MKWKRVCAAGDVAPNALRKFTVEGIPVLIANLGDGFKAYPPLCPHMEEPLETSGVCDGRGTLTCTKHLWNWNMKTGARQGEAERDLLMYDVKRQGDDILVNLEKELTYEYDDPDAGGDDDDFWKS
jgi:toluene monooxygenase system ferredoxin subunit